jgi:ubiquinone/menaquinone biosynthesis C-methylase UbiE
MQQDLSKRIGELSPARRKLLEHLIRQRAEPAAVVAPAEASRTRAAISFTDDNGGTADYSPDGTKAMYKRFYNAVTAQLDGSMFGEFSCFLNYGYLADLNPQHAVVELPEHYLNRNSVKLVLELVGEYPIDGRRVLDVGCGRGGTVDVLTKFFSPMAVTGLDLSPAAIAFCQRVHRDSRIRFEEGDAENLPFGEASFDIVTNVESSHGYPNIFTFYHEVYRVLVPGGHFLYTDVLPNEKWQECTRVLAELGVVMERDQDITSNVLLSCDQIAQTRVSAFDSGNDPELMANFLAVPGSEVYDSMQRRIWTYKIQRFRKPERV